MEHKFGKLTQNMIFTQLEHHGGHLRGRRRQKCQDLALALNLHIHLPNNKRMIEKHIYQDTCCLPLNRYSNKRSIDIQHRGPNGRRPFFIREHWANPISY